MRRLRRLCDATRAINPAAQITLHGIPDRDDFWVVRINVGTVVLIETGAGPLDKVLVEAARKLQSLSQRVLIAVSPSGDDREPDSGSDPVIEVLSEK